MKTISMPPVTTDAPEWISLDQAALILGMSQQWTHLSVTVGRFKGLVGIRYDRYPQRGYRYCRQDIEALIQPDRSGVQLHESQCAA